MQPHIFQNLPLKVMGSRLADGVMKFGAGADDVQVVANRKSWLEAAGTSLDRATLLRVGYGEHVVYGRIRDVDAADFGKGMRASEKIAENDALFTQAPGQVLFLPIADCAGVVLFDVKRQVLGLLHLGRHATLGNLAAKAIEHMKAQYGTDPADVCAWISPAISGESYWLHTFVQASEPAWRPFIRASDGGYFVDLPGYNIAQCIAAGVPKAHIERSPINTATDPAYPSHYAHQTLGQPEKAGRFAVAACITG